MKEKLRTFKILSHTEIQPLCDIPPFKSGKVFSYVTNVGLFVTLCFDRVYIKKVDLLLFNKHYTAMITSRDKLFSNSSLHTFSFDKKKTSFKKLFKTNIND